MKVIQNIIPFILLFVTGFTGLQAQTTDHFKYNLTGTVRSAETKKPLPGIRVIYKDLKSSLTDENGNFKIDLPSGEVTLVVSGPQYATRTVAVQGKKNLMVELFSDDFISPFEIIATPNGETSPLKLTHAWSANKESNILSTAITADEALQGKVSGLNMVHRSGALAAGSNVYIRGINTMNAGTQPLYVVDGVPYENSIYATSLIGNYYANPLTSIDIKDIESITVLKDGTSQYGVKGANGVVLIRTLKAKEMETRINFHYHFGMNFAPSSVPVLNAADHKLLISDVLQTQGKTGTEINALPYMDQTKPVLEKWGYEGNTDYYRYNNSTNWQDQIFTSSPNQNYYLNVFGGDNVAVYALAIGYMKQGGIIENTDFERFNTRFNAKVNLSQKFVVNANMSFLFSNKSIVDEGPSGNRNPVLASLIKAPFTASHIYNPEGAVSPVIEDADIFGNSNPFALVNTSDRTNSMFRFAGNFEAVYNHSKNLMFNAIVGVNFNKEREKLYFPNRGVAFETLSTGLVDNVSQHRVDRYFSIFSEANAKYNKSLDNDDDIQIVAGVRYQQNQAEDDWAKAANTGSDNFKSISYGDPLFRVVGGQISNWNWFNGFVSFDYNAKDKYFLNITSSADASSRYGTDANPLYYYPAVSGAWLISGEEFMSDFHNVDILKLRIGFGLSGNDDIGNYSGVQTYVPQNLLGNFGLVRGNLVDLNLKPEQAAKTNIGLDMAFLGDRLQMSVDLFRNNISDMILRIPVPRETGFPYYLTNAGTMFNQGIDFSVKYRILNGKIKWDAGLVASAYKNQISGLGGQEFITKIAGAEVLSKVGESVGVFYGYQTGGVYSTQAEAADAALKINKGSIEYPFAAGDVKFTDQDGNKIIDEKDKVIIGNPNPDLYGSAFTNLNYQNWSVNAFFTYSIGNDVYNYTRAQLEGMQNYNNQTQAVLNRWKTEGDITSMPKAVFGDPMGNARFSDRWIEDGSYLRLKTLTVSYDLSLKSKIIRACTFFAAADNLFVLSAYKGLDPEFALGTSPLYQGIDGTFVPAAKTVSIGVKLDL